MRLFRIATRGDIIWTMTVTDLLQHVFVSVRSYRFVSASLSLPPSAAPHIIHESLLLRPINQT